MSGSADLAGMLDVRSRRAFLDREIARRNLTLEMEFEFALKFSHSEIGAVHGQFLGMAFGRIFSLPFLGSSSVAAFRGSNSDGRNGVCFATSWHAREIIAPAAPHFHAAFLSIRRDYPSEGERCMKHTVHPIRHPSVHPRIFGRVGSRRSCTGHDDEFGRTQNTGLGWSDPTFVHVSVRKVIRGVAPAQLRGDRAEYIVPVQIGSGTIAKTVRNPVKFANQTRSRKRGPQ